MANPNPGPGSSSSTDYEALYTWAPEELLNECTSLTTYQDLEDHRGDPDLYNFNAFCRTHDAHISVRPGRPGEPVCIDERAKKRKPFFFMYQAVFKRLGVRLPFTPFERELLTEINTAPAQLHPNSWGFVRGFQILCGHLGIIPSVDVFLHFFEVKKQGKSCWVSFSGIAGRILLTLFQNSFKNWKGKFFRVCCAKHDPTALDGFPLYWTEHPKLLKPKTLEELSPADRAISEALAGLDIAFSTAKLIACEYNAHSLTTYFGRESHLSLCFVSCTLLLCACSIFPCLPCLHAVYYALPCLDFRHVVYPNAGSIMSSSKKALLAKALRDARAAKGDATPAPPATAADLTAAPPLGSSSPPPQTQTPGSPTPSAAVPLAMAASSSPAPLDKGKRVLVVSSDEEGSGGGIVFKRRRAARAPTPPAASPQGGNSPVDTPPSASCPIASTVQGEEGDGAAQTPAPPPAETSVTPAASVAIPDIISLPPPIMQLLRGFNGEDMPESPDRKEGMPYYLGAFLSVALDWRSQARNAAWLAHKLETLETKMSILEPKVSALEQENEKLKRQDEASQTSLKLAETAKEEARKQLAEAADQLAEAAELQADFFLREASLKIQVTGLQGMIDASGVAQEELKSRYREQAEAMSLLQAERNKLKTEVSGLVVEKEALEKQVASADAAVEALEKEKKSLIADMAGTYEEGFQEALAQAACANPGVDISNCDPTHHVVNGKVVPFGPDD